MVKGGIQYLGPEELKKANLKLDHQEAQRIKAKKDKTMFQVRSAQKPEKVEEKKDMPSANSSKHQTSS